MNCCDAQTERRRQRSWWRSAGGCVGSGTLLVLLPKCPLCIAASLAVWAGASVAMPLVARLRSMLEIVFVASAVLLLVRGVAVRTRMKLERERGRE